MPIRWQIPRDIPWATPFPLPRDTAEAALQQEKEGEPINASLQMDRLLAYSRGRQGLEVLREFGNRAALVPDFAPLADLVEAAAARWDTLARSLGAVTFTLRPEWRAVVGLGTNALLQGGLLLQRTTGLPVIPATALKGITRLHAEQIEEIAPEESALMFGTAGDEAQEGTLLFLDAMPAAVPVIERDVMNAHFALYYGGADSVPPADYLSPRPVFFLAIGKATPFRFGVTSTGGDEVAAQRGAGWLKRALETVGVGAKTAAGYGYWIAEGD